MILSIAFVSGVFFYLMRSDVFSIKKVDVRSETINVKKEIEKELSALVGENIFTINISSLSDSLLSRKKEIQSIVVTRVLPSSLTVQIKERKGVVQVFSENGVTVLDSEGFAFKKGPEALPLFWPLPKNKNDLLRVISWYTEKKPNFVNGLTWDQNIGLVVETKNRTRVYLGKKHYSESWNRAQESLDYLKSKGLRARIIDATYNARAVITL